MNIISLLLVGAGFAYFIHEWREARRAGSGAGGIDRLKRLNLRLMVALLALAPLLWVLLQFFEGDVPFIIVGVIAAPLVLASLAVAVMIGWKSGADS